MPLVVFSTEADLADWLHAELGATAEVLGFDPSSGLSATDYQQVINRTLRAYGLTGAETLADATDLGKLEAVARMEAWRQVMQATAGDVTFSSDGQSIQLSDQYKQVERQFKLASAAAMAYGIGPYGPYRVTQVPMGRTHDPYIATATVE